MFEVTNGVAQVSRMRAQTAVCALGGPDVEGLGLRRSRAQALPDTCRGPRAAMGALRPASEKSAGGRGYANRTIYISSSTSSA